MSDTHAARAERRVIPLREVTPAPYDPQAQACAACSVRQFALFGALEEAALDEIHYHIADLRLQPGETLFRARESGTAVYTVRAGVVRLERQADSGERHILRLAGRSDLLGQESLLNQTYAVDAVACTEVQACRIPRVLIEELMRKHPGIARDLMKRWQRALDDADEWQTELTRGPARHRMLRLLLKLGETSTEARIWLPARHEMGAMLAMTLETASRLVSALRRDGILDLDGAHHATVHMPRLLAALKQEEDGS